MQSSAAYAPWRRVGNSARRFVIADAGPAKVYEIESDQPEGLVQRLVFSDAWRLQPIRSYPSDWCSLDEARLLALFRYPDRD